jgi:hypothetical protein
MHLVILLLLSILVLGAGQASAEPRGSGRGETARHPQHEVEVPDQDRDYPRHRDRDRDLSRAERLDPAVRQFWSERCVRQRRFGLPHTRDCDNPAYSGGGFGYPVMRPYGGHGPHPRPPRGGRIIIERDDRGSASSLFRPNTGNQAGGRW